MYLYVMSLSKILRGKADIVTPSWNVGGLYGDFHLIYKSVLFI